MILSQIRPVMIGRAQIQKRQYLRAQSFKYDAAEDIVPEMSGRCAEFQGLSDQSTQFLERSTPFCQSLSSRWRLSSSISGLKIE
jgi:hypothetical protein